MTFGDLMKQRRLVLGMSQRELAEKIRVSDSLISKIERGQRLPRDRDMVVQLALVLDADITEYVDAFLKEKQGPPLDDLQQQLATFMVEVDADLSATETIMEMNRSMAEYVAGLAGDADDEERTRSRHIRIGDMLLLTLWLAELEDANGYALAISQLDYRRSQIASP